MCYNKNKINVGILSMKQKYINNALLELTTKALKQRKENDHMLDEKINSKLQLFKLNYKERFSYVSEIWELLKDVITQSDIIFLYGQKNSGKSTIGYNLMSETLKQGKNVVYGRLQMKEKDNALADIVRVMQLVHGINLQKIRGNGSSLYFVDGDIHKPYVRFVSMGDYQMTRSTVNENTGLIFFDEINTTTFKPDFIDNLINTISTLARDNQVKFYGCGNNETAQNNPILSMLQVALDWSYRGLQIANRIIHGANCTVIQCGGDIFDKNRPVTLAQRLGVNNLEYANKFLYGINLDVKNRLILNVPEFIKNKIPKVIYCNLDGCYLFSTCLIDDEINNNRVNGWYVENITNIDDYKIPKYAVDDYANMYYKQCIKLDDEQISNQFRKFYFGVKRNLVYFKDFETQEVIFKLFVMYNNNDIIDEVERIN